MQAFPLIEAFWASLDREQPSGDDPVRVAAALHRFYLDFQRAYLQGRRHRWKTPLFQTEDPLLRAGLEQAIELTGNLSSALPFDTALLAQLGDVDPQIRKAAWALEQEEKTFGLTAYASPKLCQLDYLFEGWARKFLPVDPLEAFLQDFIQAASATQKEIEVALATAKTRDTESNEEKEAICSASTGVDGLIAKLIKLQANLALGVQACRPLRDAIFDLGAQLGQSYQKLEQVAPVGEPCPFCGGNLSLSGRCRNCGRRLPHLEDTAHDRAADAMEPQSPFISNHIRRVDLALNAFYNDPDNEELWREFQESVRTFGRQVDAGRQHIEKLQYSPDRPIDSASPERLAEQDLVDIAKVFHTAQRALAQFAFQPFPAEGDLPEGWRDPLLAIEPKLQALENKWSPASAEDDPTTASS